MRVRSAEGAFHKILVRLENLDLAPTALTLLQLPVEAIVLVLGRLDARSLARVAATYSELNGDKPRPMMNSVVEALRQRATACGRVCPDRLPNYFSSWAAHLAWLECRRDEAWTPVAAGRSGSLFVAEGGRLMSSGIRGVGVGIGLLGYGELDCEGVATPTLLPSMVGIRIGSVAAGHWFSAAVSAAGVVYTWGIGSEGILGHGDTEGSLVPKQVQALAGHRVLSVAAGHRN